jgi:capping protein (actin filament) muscle Z-line, beta
MRKIEIQANEAFDTYREMYYEGGVSSVFLWDPEDPSGGSNFAGVVVLKKSPCFLSVLLSVCSHISIWSLAMTPTSVYEPSGSWDSIHVFETAERGRQAHYKLTSTVMLQLITRKGTEGEVKLPAERKGLENNKRDGEVSLSGSMTRQVCTGLSHPPTDMLNVSLLISE